MFQIEQQKPLLNNKWFIFSFTAPIIIGLSLGLWVWFPLEVNFSAEGYNHFLSIGAFPLSIISLSIPIAGIFSLIHTSKQNSHIQCMSLIRIIRSHYRKYLESANCVLVVLYKIANQTAVINVGLNNGKLSPEQLRDKLHFICSSWTALFFDDKYTSVMSNLYADFEKIDANMTGYEILVRRAIEDRDIQVNHDHLKTIVDELENLTKTVKKFHAKLVEELNRAQKQTYEMHGIYNYKNDEIF